METYTHGWIGGEGQNMAQDRADDAFKEYLTRCRLMQAEELLRGKGTGRSALQGQSRGCILWEAHL